MTVFADTHETIKQLAAEGGMSERAAEILVSAINRGMDGTVATKGDLAQAKTELKGDIAALKQHIDTIETRISNRMYAVGIVMVGLIVTAQHIWK